MAGTITYSELRDLVCGLEAAAYADLDAAEQTRMALWCSKAYRQVYGFHRWPEAWVVDEFEVVDGLVDTLTTDDFYFQIEAFSADPRPASSRYYSIPVKATDAEGIWLDTTLGTAWLRYIPRPTVFDKDTPNATLLWLLQDATATLVQSYWATSLQQEARAQKLAREAQEILHEVATRVMLNNP